MSERKLTQDEQKRLNLFNDTAEKLREDGYTANQLTVSAVKANVIGLLLGMALSFPFIILYFVFNLEGFETPPIVVILLIFAVGIIIHEMVHGLTWSLFTKGKFKSIAFGFVLRSLTPYSSCKEPLRTGQYIAGLLMPCLIVGIIPTVLSVIIGNPTLFIPGILMIMSAGGDLLILMQIITRKRKSKDVLFLDHPTELGLVCFEKG